MPPEEEAPSNEEVSQQRANELLATIRDQIKVWRQADPHSDAELHAALAAINAMTTLDEGLSSGAPLPVDWDVS